MSSYHTIPFIFRVNTLKLRNFCQFPPSFDFQPVSLCFYLFFCHCFSCVGFFSWKKEPVNIDINGGSATNDPSLPTPVQVLHQLDVVI